MTDGRNLFIVTGGPGSGKSTLIAALAKAGHPVSTETGRAIIREQQAIGGGGTPWGDRRLYAELMLSRQVARFEAHAASGRPTFCDRGVPDILGYARLIGLDAIDHFERAAKLYRYNRTVFVAPHWPEIFVNDAERRQDEAEAERTWRIMVETYAGLGYDTVELPKASVAERSAFILETAKTGISA